MGKRALAASETRDDDRRRGDAVVAGCAGRPTDERDLSI
jgi:hypothetical protein